MKMKKTVCLVLLIVSVFLFSEPASAAVSSGTEDYQRCYQEQMRQSGAEDLPDRLPKETQKTLEQLGVSGTDWESITSITPKNYFQKILDIFTGKMKNPLRILASIIAVVLLCALLNGLRLSFGEQALGQVIGMVGALCICTIVVSPLVSCISDSADVLKAASGFLLACVPVLVGIMAAGGQPVSAGSYHLLMLAAGDAVSIFATTVLVPMMDIFLALSVVSAISPGIRLDGLCSVFNKVVKWVMGLVMTLFTGLITMHSVLAASMDTTGVKAVKFVVSSCVPVVGNALSDAMNTVNSCIRTLKSGVGAFGLLAGIFIFLPVLAECLLWLITLTLGSGISRIFELDGITSLLKASADVVSTLLAILLCCMMVLIISTVLMLMLGGAA
jgi:stage III sporulation protein AE